ncbi:CsbD family protein [Kibdelosporangium aridum]|uniref:CsbD family protein n=1 Tax=Kibdelosporangium aridum TaxID=2030 RepID=UPI000525AE5E
MALSDKITNKAEELGGKAKEATGQATGNDGLVAEGKTDQAKATVKNAVEDVKDTVKKILSK